ncbi:MAG: LytR C-terminal domain-containing protein, partial [Candidatus Magasanikbacteria bacterium]|nr:LytR C-terminal domain-containing protein [Candidatus Magasanikbacteria bacterium]
GRAARQQKIMEAAKDEVLSMNTLLNPMKISNLITDVSTHVDTNLKLWEMVKLWNNFKDVKKENIVNKVLDNSTSGLLMDSKSSDGAYLLVPRSGDFSEIQYFINSVFTDAPEEQKTKITLEKATVEVRNGTWVNGLASKSALDLERNGFTVTRIANSSRQNFEKSVIYDLTYGEKMESLSVLKEKTGANISFGLPDWLVEDIKLDTENKNAPQPDFILILGQNADSSNSGTNNPEDSN